MKHSRNTEESIKYMIMITKQEVMEALDLIENYKIQQLESIIEIEIKIDNRPISILGLKTRENNCLSANKIDTIGDFFSLNKNSLRRFRNLGEKGIENINTSLKLNGIDIGPFKTKY